MFGKSGLFVCIVLVALVCIESSSGSPIIGEFDVKIYKYSIVKKQREADSLQIAFMSQFNFFVFLVTSFSLIKIRLVISILWAFA